MCPDGLQKQLILPQPKFQKCGGNFVEFNDLWENFMIRSFSEAVCKTVGSVMNQHSRHNRYLQPIYFSIEMCLRWNLGPLHFLKYLIEDVYNRDKKLYIRKTTRTDQVVTKDLTKSAVISTFQKKIWRKVQSTSLILDLKQPTQIFIIWE